MTNKEFENLLKKADLSKKGFADLVKMNANSVTNWNQAEQVPEWVRSWLEMYIEIETNNKQQYNNEDLIEFLVTGKIKKLEISKKVDDLERRLIELEKQQRTKNEK